MEKNFLKIAKQAASAAGKIITKYSGNFGAKTIKGGDKSNFATKADLEAEKIIIDILMKAFPTHSVIAEESGRDNKYSEYRWVIDPLDGTISFASGIPTYGVSIGLLKDNKPILGVINHVSDNNLYWAEVGKGAYLNGKKIAVSQIKILEESSIGLDFGHKNSRQGKIDAYVTPLVNKISYPYCFGSSVTTEAMVAAGQLEAYINQAWIWDFVAGTVIVREAGGKVTDFEGREPDWSKERLNIVASNGLIHDQILEALR